MNFTITRTKTFVVLCLSTESCIKDMFIPEQKWKRLKEKMFMYPSNYFCVAVSFTKTRAWWDYDTSNIFLIKCQLQRYVMFEKTLAINLLNYCDFNIIRINQWKVERRRHLGYWGEESTFHFLRILIQTSS